MTLIEEVSFHSFHWGSAVRIIIHLGGLSDMFLE